MIVDVHYHLIPMLPEEVIEHVVEAPMWAARFMGKDINKATLIKRAAESFADPTGEGLLASMEESGIDFTCICAVDNIETEALTTELAQTQNQLVGQIAQNNPDKVMAFAGIDPRRPNATDMLKQCFEEFGMKGLKYHPDYGFDPAGPESYKLLEIVQENGGILQSHTGPLRPPSRCKYAEPALLADLAVDFPDLNVIGAHMGLINWRPWAALASHQPTLYGDLAMWDVIAFGHYDLFCRELRDLIDFAGVEKVLFGTDAPIFAIVEPVKNWVQLIKDLPKDAPDGITFTEEEIDAILGGNAQKLLGLE